MTPTDNRSRAAGALIQPNTRCDDTPGLPLTGPGNPVSGSHPEITAYEWERMGWRARQRYTARQAYELNAQQARLEAENLLDSMFIDSPRLIAKRRAVLFTEYRR